MDDKDVVQLKVEFATFKKHVEENIVELKKENEQLNKRVIELEKNTEKTDFQYEQIMKTLEKLNDKTIPDLVKQIEDLKNRPAERYNLIINTIISSIAGGIGGYILKTFIK